MPLISLDTSLFRAYSAARAQFLRSIDCSSSCRDPIAEFSERLVNQLLNGKLADSCVQKGFDLTTLDGRRVQVKYLANPVGRWCNEHTVVFADGTNDYAVVFFEGFELLAVIVFREETLGAVCAALCKRHPNQERTLQFTQANFRKIISTVAEFETLGVTAFLSQPNAA